jgi:hypothetical protein
VYLVFFPKKKLIGEFGKFLLKVMGKLQKCMKWFDDDK